MTQEQKSLFENALERALRLGVEVVGVGVANDGRKVYAVSSSSDKRTWHTVTVVGLSLTCNCKGAKYGRYCMHRAVTRQKIESELAEERAHVAAMTQTNARWDITPAGRAALNAHRDTAILYRSNAAVSMFR